MPERFSQQPLDTNEQYFTMRVSKARIVAALTVSLPSAIMRSPEEATLHVFLRERPLELVSMLLRAAELDRRKPRAHGTQAEPRASTTTRQRISLPSFRC